MFRNDDIKIIRYLMVVKKIFTVLLTYLRGNEVALVEDEFILDIIYKKISIIS